MPKISSPNTRSSFIHKTMIAKIAAASSSSLNTKRESMKKSIHVLIRVLHRQCESAEAILHIVVFVSPSVVGPCHRHIVHTLNGQKVAF